MSKSATENGVELPILAKDSNDKWISKYDLPSGPSDVRFGRSHFREDTVDPAHLDHLDDVASKRKIGAALTYAERAFENSPSTATKDALESAQRTYEDRLGDVPNNSRLGERLGEDAARYHVIPEGFPSSEWVPLPKTPNGADMFDQLYSLGDGKYLIVEAKAPKGDLQWRKGAGTAEGMMVKQGTKEYVRTIIAKMQSRAGRSPTEGQMALELLKAMKANKLQYVLVRANENAGSYAGATLEYFKIT
ncbi:hypothetical protein [Streptomyces sp. WMMC905]|uniref:hypothetical protein n=1 Tax=Streptomyces sp. WMMC905 TaxID=3404123 RepID=UPI003B964D85